MDYLAFSDESYVTAERYRSIATFSIPENEQMRVEETLNETLRKSNVSEFKWNKVKDAKYRFCAKAIIDNCFTFIAENMARVDILIWDTQDSRHNMLGRDDERNYEIMFYHLSCHVIQKRGKRSYWKLYPDEKMGVDWDRTCCCVKRKCQKLTESSFSPFWPVEDLRNSVTAFGEVRSHLSPCNQVADLFAGIAVFSINCFDKYIFWKRTKDTLSLFEEDELLLSNREKERFDILSYFSFECKEKRLGVSLESSKCLKTYLPTMPINFWHYSPQHCHDRAPIRPVSH